MEEEENFYRFKVTIPEDKKDLFDENMNTIDLL
jgi:hypothetical protein